MPRVTAFNLRAGDPLPAIEDAVRDALVSMSELQINEHEIDLVPMRAPEGYDAAVARIDVDLWEHPARSKDALQELAERVATAFKAVAGEDRNVKVVIRPYDVGTTGWVSR
jgi:phenylpyruvate tautomerase PptA (4-oxalocrotonate tautomerase family)